MKPAFALATPFLGLRPFREADAPFFFGRDQQIEALLDRLDSRRLVAVVGTSGSGKSSLVGAGLIPTILRGHLGPTNTTWLIANIFRPGTDPLATLAHALTQTFAAKGLADATQIKSDLLKSSAGLSAFAKLHLAPHERLLLFVDQFEELFRYREQAGVAGRDRSTAFVRLLLAATGAKDMQQVYVVLTMRSDYLGKCAQFRGLPEALNDAQYLVPRLSRDQLRETIEGPIALAGSDISSDLTDRLLNDTGDNPDMLPLLQHALARLWEESKGSEITLASLESVSIFDRRAWEESKGSEITLAHYHAVGEISDALNRDADNAFAEIPDPRKSIVRRVFQRLVEPASKDEETRRPTRLSELAQVCTEPQQTVRDALSPFAERGFINYSEDKDPLVDISHESLIRQWRKLREWVADESKSAAVYQRLADAAANKRDAYRGATLVEASAWRRQAQPNAAWASRYSDVSFDNAMHFLRRSERWKGSRLLGVAAVIALIATAISFYRLYRSAEQQTHTANSLRLVAQAQLQESNQPDLAFLLGIEAHNAAANYESLNGLLTGIQDNQALVTILHQGGAANSVVFSADGKLLASASGDNTVLLWDAVTRRLLGRLTGHAGPVQGVVFSPDGRLLASVSRDQTVRLWDVAARKSVGVIGHAGSLLSVAFSPDDKLLASAGGDKSIRLWDVATCQPVRRPLLGHGDAVWSVAFSPDGKLLASGSWDKTVRLWDVAARRPVGQPISGHTDDVLSVAFSPDGKLLASASRDKTMRLWDLATRQPLRLPFAYTEAVTSVAFSPDGKLLASGSENKTIRMMDLAEQHSLGESLIGHTDPVWGVAFSPDGKLLASASADKTVRLWDVATRHPVGQLISGHSGHVLSVAFSSDGQLLASTGADGTVWLWNLVTRQPEGQSLVGHTGAVQTVAFSPDSKLLASAGQDKTVRLWDVVTRQPVGQPLSGHKNQVMSVAFSPNGKLLASGSLDKTVRLWDVAKRQPAGPALPNPTNVLGVAFSRDGKLLAAASGDRTVRLWDLATRQLVGQPLPGHSQGVSSVAFAAYLKLMGSASYDRTARLWDLVTYQPLGRPLSGHTKSIFNIAFSPSAKLLATASEDNSVRLWDIDPQSWISRTCTMANRNLSLNEWHTYIGADVPYRRTCPNLPDGEGVHH